MQIQKISKFENKTLTDFSYPNCTIIFFIYNISIGIYNIIYDIIYDIYKEFTKQSRRKVLDGREVFKPFDYPEFYQRWKDHERAHWLPAEVTMHEDINDWNNKLTEKQKDILTNLFRFFTQGDVEVAGAYCSEYIPYFYKTPEIAMFLTSVAAREAIHMDGYSYLIETHGMPEKIYSEFLEYAEMRDKYSYLKKYQNQYYILLNNYKLLIIFPYILVTLLCFQFELPWWYTYLVVPIIIGRFYRYIQFLVKDHIAGGIALFSAFTEGMQLFSSFTMLLAFPKNGLMKGMGQIVTWSIADETQHIDGMISLFKIFRREYSETTCECKYKELFGCSCINLKNLEDNVYKIAREMVRLEDCFIDLIFSKLQEDNDEFLGIKRIDIKNFIRYITNKRLIALDYNPLYEKLSHNPLPEFEIMINAPAQTNFFENKSTDYAKADLQWNKIWMRKLE